MHSNKFIGTTDTVLGIVFGAIKGIITINLSLMILGIIPIGFIQNFVASTSDTIFVNIINKIDVVSLILKAMASVNIPELVVGMLS